MNFEDSKNRQDCPREDVFHYLEGQLSLDDEATLEKHLAVCEICFAEVKSQRELSRVLNSVFIEQKELALPKDFTKIVVANAESKVTGLRCPGERTKAIFISCVLFLLLCLGFSAETERTFQGAGEFSRTSMALAGFAGHFVFDISLGIAVVLRFLSNQIVFNPVFSVALLMVAVSLVFFRIRSRLSRS